MARILQYPHCLRVSVGMMPHRYLVQLLAAALGVSTSGGIAAEAVKPSEPAGAAPASSPAEAAKNAQPAKSAPAKPPDEAKLRATISKSLGFLAKEGDQWMTDKNCNGCHHMPELLWSHREATLRGFAVDQKKFDEWLSWSVERATDKKPGLEEAALMMLAMPERPAPELVKLLAAEQKPDGTWNPAGQFATMQKRGSARCAGQLHPPLPPRPRHPAAGAARSGCRAGESHRPAPEKGRVHLHGITRLPHPLRPAIRQTGGCGHAARGDLETAARRRRMEFVHGRESK